MGEAAVRRALESIFERELPEAIFSVGFAGAVTRELQVGDVVLGRRFVLWSSGQHSNSRGRTEPAFLEAEESGGPILSRLSGFPFFKGGADIVTCHRPPDKRALADCFSHSSAAADMETWFVASMARQRSVPVISLRAVSDALHDPVDFDLDAIADASGRVSAAKALRSILVEPALAGSFFNSWRRSRKAAENLGNVLACLVTTDFRRNQPNPGPFCNREAKPGPWNGESP
jgi:hypothetical protein